MNVYFKEPCYTIRHLNFQTGEDDKSCKLPVTRRPRKRTRRLTTRTDAWKWEVDCRPTQWISINKYKRQSGKWAKYGNRIYHLEAGVTVVGPHLDSARQLAQSDHNVSHVAMCYNVSHVTDWEFHHLEIHLEVLIKSLSKIRELMWTLSFLGFRTSSDWKLMSQSGFPLAYREKWPFFPKFRFLNRLKTLRGSALEKVGIWLRRRSVECESEILGRTDIGASSGV